jgi:hypothetical protein
MTIAWASAGSVLRPWPVTGHPGPGGQFGWHVQYPFAAGQQPLRQRPPDPVGAFHRPRPPGPLPRVGQQLPVAAHIGTEPALGPQNLPAVPGLDRHRQLVRIHPDDHLVHHEYLLAYQAPASEDGQRYFELSRPFLSHASPRHPAKAHAMKEPRPTNRTGSRKESTRPGTSPEPALARAV